MMFSSILTGRLTTISQTYPRPSNGEDLMTDAIFGTMVPAMVTPFTENGELDLDATQTLANHLVDHGADGIVATGTTGETSTLTDDENVKVFEAIVEAVGGRAKVVAGTGVNDTAHSTYLSKRAEAAGVDGLLLVTPYYNKPDRKSTRLNSSHVAISYAVFCL